MDLKTQEISRCIDLLTTARQVNKFAKILYYKESLWLIPRNAIYILEYKIFDNSVIRYNIPHKENELGIRYRDAVCVKGKIYALLERGNSIRVFNIEDSSCYLYKLPIKERNVDKRFFWSICTDEKNLYLLADKFQYSYRINLETMQTEKWEKRETFQNAWHTEYIEGYIYEMPYKKNLIYKHSINSSENKKIISLDEVKLLTYKCEDLGFVTTQILKYKRDKKILISYLGNKCLFLDSNDNILIQQEILYNGKMIYNSLQNYLNEILVGNIKYWRDSERILENNLLNGEKIWNVLSNR